MQRLIKRCRTVIPFITMPRSRLSRALKQRVDPIHSASLVTAGHDVRIRNFRFNPLRLLEASKFIDASLSLSSTLRSDRPGHPHNEQCR